MIMSEWHENEVLVPPVERRSNRETHRRDLQLYSSVWR